MLAYISKIIIALINTSKKHGDLDKNNVFVNSKNIEHGSHYLNNTVLYTIVCLKKKKMIIPNLFMLY